MEKYRRKEGGHHFSFRCGGFSRGNKGRKISRKRERSLYLSPGTFYLSAMSDEAVPYSPRYIQVWTALSIFLGLVLIGMFFFGDHLMHLGHIIWALLRWICSSII
jgi:hypothetical protein